MSYPFSYHMAWVWDQTKGFRFRLTLYLVLEIVAAALTLLFVYWSKRAIDITLKVVEGGLRETLILVGGAILVATVLQLYTSWLNEKIRVSMLIRLQNRLIDDQMMSAWSYVKKWNTGDLMVRLNSDVNEVIQMIVKSGPTFVVTVLKLIGAFCFLWIMDPMLAWMIIAISPLFLFSKVYLKKMRELSRAVKQGESDLGNVLQENLKLRMLIRGMGLTEIRQQKLEQNQWSIFGLKMRQLAFSTFTQGIMRLTMNGGYLLTFAWGVYRLHHGQISFGTMTAFLQLVGRVQGPIISGMGFIPTFIKFRTSLDRLIALDDVERETESPAKVLKNIKAIRMNNLTFQYEDTEVIKSLSMNIRQGEPTAVIGSSGKGKTTLIRLILSLIMPNSGTIYLDTENGSEVLNPAHRANFSYIPQGGALFSGTIRENLTMLDKNVNHDRIEEVLSMACADFVYDLPDGLDTYIGEQGFGLSEGQAQRVGIARSLIRDTNIWIFDEATSALDEATSNLLFQKIIEKSSDKIMIFVTHDLSLAAKCHQTIYMN